MIDFLRRRNCVIESLINFVIELGDFEPSSEALNDLLRSLALAVTTSSKPEVRAGTLVKETEGLRIDDTALYRSEPAGLDSRMYASCDSGVAAAVKMSS